MVAATNSDGLDSHDGDYDHDGNDETSYAATCPESESISVTHLRPSGAKIRAKKIQKRKGGEKPLSGKFKRSKKGALYTGDNPDKLIESSLIDTNDQPYSFDVQAVKVSELINEVCFTSLQRAAVSSGFSKIGAIIRKIQHIPHTELIVEIPAPNHDRREKLLSECFIQAPVDVALMGSYAHGLALRLRSAADVRVVIPAKYFRAKDYLNQRYLVKKAFYLACIAHHIKKGLQPDCLLEYVSPQDNHLDVALCVSLPESVKMYIYCQLEESTLSLKRFTATTNNVRPEHIGQPIQGERVLPPTPLYNMTALTNLLYKHTDTLLAQYLSNKTVRDVLWLLKIWLHQRQLDQGSGCFSSFVGCMFTIYLLKSGNLKLSATSYQTFINLLHQIALADWSVGFSLSNDTTKEELANHKLVSSHALLDPSGLLNYCAAVHTNAVEWVKKLAKESCALSVKGNDIFSLLFIHRLPHYLQLDHYIRVDAVDSLTCTSSSMLLDSCGDVFYSALPLILQTVKRGLGERIYDASVAPVLRVRVPVDSCTKLGQLQNNMLVIGFHVNPDKAYNTTDRGPAADHPQATEFREFWGEKSSLRRFLDGAICEAVVWPADTLKNKRTLLGKIVSYVLQRHCRISPSLILYAVNQLDDVLMYDDIASSSPLRRNVGTGEEEHLLPLAALEMLAKHLRAEKTLPLKITDIQGLECVCRYTEVFPPKPAIHRKKEETIRVSYPAVSVVCTLEGSGKWPADEDKLALSSLKVLFLLQLKDSLNQLDSVIAMIKGDILTVLVNGFLFNIELVHKYEMDRLRIRHETEASLARFVRYALLPQITSVLHGLGSQFTGYSTTSRLLKRWLGIHLLSPFLPEPFVDLLVSHVFVHPQPYHVPVCPMVAFLRALQLLVHHDWANEPLIVNLNGVLSVAEVEELSERFRSQRCEFPCATLLTPYDKESVLSRAVMPFMMKRVCETAQLCLQRASNLLCAGKWYTELLKEALFGVDLQSVDLLIELKPLKYRETMVTLEQDSKIITCVFDPAYKYIEQIKAAYSEVAVILYDQTAPKYIGIVWKPDAFSPLPVQAATRLAARSLDSSHGNLFCKLDLKAVVQDLNVTGQYLVSRIAVNETSD